MDLTAALADQLDWHWTNQLRPRLRGLSDAEYLWEPVPGAWTIHPVEPADQTDALGTTGSRVWTIDWAFPPPQPTPVTTIAWRLTHLIVGVFGARVAGHFGGPPADYDSHAYAATADEALAQLDRVYAAWIAGVRGLDAAALEQPCGPVEGPWAEVPMAGLVLHINREAIHHGAEIALLRDLWAHRR